MAMEDKLFIDVFPLETPISGGFPIATFDFRKVTINTIKHSCGQSPF